MPALRSRLTTAALGLSALAVVLGIITFPDEAFNASMQGLSIWWDIVFPALLPYLILNEMMLAQGLVHGFGIWIEPFMRSLFRLPGVSGWAIAVGLSSGPPVGTEMTARLRKQGLLNQREGELLLALSSLFNPVFLISVISVGFFEQSGLALFIVFVHYISALITGLLWSLRFNINHPSNILKKETPPEQHTGASIWIRSFHAMNQARQADGRSFGKLLGDSVTHAIQTLMMIGGLMMIFSVLIKLLELMVWPHQATLWLSGLLEIHLGTYAMSQSYHGPWVWNIAVVCALLGFSGLCIHAQVKSFIRGTDLRYTSFFFMKLLHGLISFALAVVCWAPYQHWMLKSLSTLAPAGGASHSSFHLLEWTAYLPHIGFMILPVLLLIMLAGAGLISIAAHFTSR